MSVPLFFRHIAACTCVLFPTFPRFLLGIGFIASTEPKSRKPLKLCPNKTTFTSISNGQMACDEENSRILIHTHISRGNGDQERLVKQVFLRGLAVFQSHINHSCNEQLEYLCNGDPLNAKDIYIINECMKMCPHGTARHTSQQETVVNCLLRRDGRDLKHFFTFSYCRVKCT